MSTITGIPTYSSAPINPNTVTPSKAQSPTASPSKDEHRTSPPPTPAITTPPATSSSSPLATSRTPRPGTAAIDLLPAPTGAITSSHHNGLPPPTRTTPLRPTDQLGSGTEKPKHVGIPSKTTGDFVPPQPQPGARPQPVTARPRGSPPRPVPDSAPSLTTSGSGSSVYHTPSGPAATTVSSLPANNEQAGRSARGNRQNIQPYLSNPTPVVPNSTSTPYATVYTPPTQQQQPPRLPSYYGDRHGSEGESEEQGILQMAKTWVNAAGTKLAEAEAEVWRHVK